MLTLSRNVTQCVPGPFNVVKDYQAQPGINKQGCENVGGELPEVQFADAELVAACKTQDLQAQTEFVRRFKHPVFKRMLRYTGSVEVAEDLTQEALIRALNNISMFREAVTLDGWVFRIAQNLMRDHFRSEKIRRTEPLTAVHEYVQAGWEAAPGSDDILVHQEERKLLASAVNRLSDIYREVVLLAHYDGKSVDDISRMLKIGTSAVKMRLKRAREELMKALEADHG